MKKMYSLLAAWRLPLLLAVLGGAAGWLYYRYVGCITGTCPIRSDPTLMLTSGAIIGFLLGYAFRPVRRKNSTGDRK